MNAPEAQTITIRRAGEGDQGALRRLAELDSVALPRDEFLLGEVGGVARAAVGLCSGAVAADPFHRTTELVDHLRLAAERLCAPDPRRRARRRVARQRAAVGTVGSSS